MSAAQALPRKQPTRDFFAVIKQDLAHLTEKKPKEPHSRVSSESQLAMIIRIVGDTFGSAFGRSTPPLYASLTHRQLAQQGGCSLRQAVDLLADAEKRKLIESIDFKRAVELGLVGPKHRGHQQAKWYRALPENWATAPKYSPPKPKLVVMEPPEDDEPAAAEDGDGDGAPPVVKVPPDQPLVLMPGTKSRPVPWVSKATRYSFDCSGATVPLSIERECCFGVVKFKIRDSNQQLTASSQNANRRRNGEPPMQSTSGVNRGVSEVAAVTVAVSEEAIVPDDDGIKRMIRDCRANAPDARTEEIEHFVHVKAPGVRRARNPFGLLIEAVPACFKGESFKAFRKRQSKPEAAKCRRCGAPLGDGLVIDGACFDCSQSRTNAGERG